MSRETILIAEIGENHIGDWDRARQMVAEAARAGADVVKFQSYRASDVAPGDPEKEWFAQVQLPDELHFELVEHAQACGVEFMSTPFTVERARFLCERVKLRKIKIASSEILNFSLLDYVNQNAQEVFLSTGMSTLEEIGRALGHLDRVREVCLLHCVTQYPAQDEEVNLRAIPSLSRAFPDRLIGYSDHALGTEAAVAAVALGATVIEKHFTLSKTLPGTDHILSATPDEFFEMSRRIRRLEVLLGEAVKAPVPREKQIRDFVRNRWRKEERVNQ